MSKKSSGIKRLKDLNHKKIALYDDINGIAISSMLKAHHIQFIRKPVAYKLEKLKNNEIDAMIAYGSNEPFVAQEMGMDVSIINPNDYGFERYGDILFTSTKILDTQPELVERMYRASKKGFEYAFSHIDEVVELIYTKYNTLNKSKEALYYEANTLKKLTGLGENFGVFSKEKIESIAYIYSYTELGKYDLNYLDHFIYKTKAVDIDLTQEEKKYLQENRVTYAGDPNWLPYEAFTKDGNYIGIIADHIEIIENRLNIKFDKVITENWLDTLELSKTNKVDIISGDAADAVLNQNYKPIDTYIKNPLVIVTNKDHEYILDLNQIKDKKIAFISGAGYSADIVKKYPDIKFLECETLQSGLLGVKTGKYDAFIGSLTMVEYTIVSMGIEDIKIAGQTDIVMNVTLFVDKNKPLLYSILNKVMKTISANRQHEIISKWRDSNVKKVIDYTLVWQISILFFILTLIGLFFTLLLRKNNKKLHALLNSTIEGMVISKDGICHTANQPAMDLFGYKDSDDTKQLHILDFVSEESKELLKSKIKDSTTAPYEAIMKKKDGSLFPALVKGINLGDGKTRISTIIDLTKLKQAEQQTLYLSERMELAFDGSRDGLWDWNLIENSVYFSPRWKEMLGYRDDELENSFDTWQSRVHPDDLEEALKNIESCVKDKEKVFENKHRLRHKDGHWVWIYDRGKVQRDKDGKAIRMIGTHTDLTTEINLSNELSELNKNLETRVKEQVEELDRRHIFMAQQARLASMGEMLSSIAHQWRQPLNCINSDVAVISSIMARDTIDQEMLLSQIEKIENNTQYMSDTIEDFSNFFRPDKQKTEFMLHDTVKSALELLAPRSKNIEINTVFNKDTEVLSFKEEYRQVILIILNNAIDNFESRKTQNPKIDIIIKEHDNTTYLSICDNGGGIDKDKIDRIFEPYYTTKFANEGVGLGLYMGKMLIEDSMQGKLEVKNKNDGACFEIRVPKGVENA
ncbi:PAS domain-containing protein [Sulfurovum sp. CS9]|uniref:PAS domain-containing protein n=1 Tax=Sulfurovum sp. CS9 TaxID=3391146 RepID=UPI0039EA4981